MNTAWAVYYENLYIGSVFKLFGKISWFISSNVANNQEEVSRQIEIVLEYLKQHTPPDELQLSEKLTLVAVHDPGSE